MRTRAFFAFVGLGLFLSASVASAENPHQLIGYKARDIGRTTVSQFSSAVKHATKMAKKIQTSHEAFEQYPSIVTAMDLLIDMKQGGNAIREAGAHKVLLGEHGAPSHLVNELHQAMRDSGTAAPESIVGKKAHILKELKSNTVGRKLLVEADVAREFIDYLVEDLPTY